MLSLLLASLVVAPQWTADHNLKPKPVPGLELSADSAPRGIVVMPARRKATLEVAGPGTLRVRAWGLMKKSGAKLSNPGKVRVWVGTVQRKTIELPAEAADGWFVIGKPRWRVGGGEQVEFPLSAGTHKVSLQHLLKRGAIGFALLVEVVPADTTIKEEAAAVAVAEPPADEPGGEVAVADEPVIEPPTDEPAIEAVADEPALEGPAGDDGPALVASPTTMLGHEPGIEVTAPATMHTLSGPDGAERFYRVAIDPGMVLKAYGPGTVVLELHAHRAESNAETLEPVVLGILLDDVLVETLSLATPTTDEFEAEGGFDLSGRVAVRIPVPLGEHKLQLSLSDNAVLGASVRPRFLGIGNDEPEVLDLGTARAGDLVAGSAKGGILIGVLGGLWTPNAFREVGAGGTFEGGFAIPVRNSRLLINFIAGLGYTDASRQVEDPNVVAGQSRVRIKQTTVPLLLGATWSASMPAAGLSAELGVGGGAVLNWTATRYRKVDAESALGVSPALSFWSGAAYEVGPGAFLLRVTVVAALPYSGDTVSDFDPGAVLVGTGYRFDFGS